MHVMTDDNPRERPSEPMRRDRQVKRAPPPKAKENPWDHEPSWLGGDDDDEVVADGMCDDDSDSLVVTQLPAPLGLRESALWEEAIARIRASRFRGESS
ncbi:MAG TPA: hypothetical protein VJ860_21090 [Polyangia bacterium]|jgi:hypothetical protein|nr:hypothetical protein [Polyangia bacterium]